MALGVLNNLSAIYAENNLNNTNSSLQNVLRQLSSGSRINSGADDAAGLSLVNGLQANSRALTQSATNATEGVGLLQVADGALSQVTNLLNRAITLATEASNGTLNSSQGAAANQEYQSILAEINNIGSTTTYNQQAVFSGRTVAIYTGDASLTGSSIDNLYIRTLSAASVGDTGGAMSYSNGRNNVFLDLSRGGNNASVTDSLNGGANGSTTVTVNYLAKGGNGTYSNATANITVGAGSNYANTAQGLIDAINNSGLGLSAAFTTAAQAGSVAVAAARAANVAGGGASDTGITISGIGVGTGTDAAGEIGALTVGAQNDTLGGTLNIVGSDGKSHAFTLGQANSTDTVANLAGTINAAGLGVTATPNVAIVGGHAVGTVLTFTADDASINVSATNLTDNGAAIAMTGQPSITDTFTSTVGKITIGGTGTAADTLSAGKVLTLGPNAITIQAGVNDTLAKLTSYINTGNFGVTASVDSTGKVMSLTSSNSALTVSGNLTDAAGGGATLTTTNNAADHNQIGTIAVGGLGWADTNVMTGTSFTFGTQTFTVAPGTTYGNLASAINAANLGVTVTEAANGTLTFVSNNAATEGVTLSATMTDSVGTVTFTTTSDTPSTSSSSYFSIGITGSILDTSTNGGTLNTGWVADANGNGSIAMMSYTDGAGANLSATDLSTQVHAQAALTALNEAIADVAAMDGYIGAQINILNAISQVMSTQQENIVSAQNAIQATDYASATSNMSKYEILSQTGIAALAQANQVQQEVTKLLQ